MSHIIAIIGRPNVGKSTLFNRILGAREAIVHDQPGVTRDRHYGEAEWAGKQFTLIDTGGFVPKSTDLFERAIREQAEIAISEASEIIFLVDATEGITPLDAELAAILRKSKKKIHLVVNKVDNETREMDAPQFFSLGLGEPIPISAIAGRRIGDFLDALTGNISANGEDTADDKRLHLAIVGKPNVGKSSIVNALLGAERHIVTDIPGTTRDAIDSVLKFHGREIVLIDTAGLRRRSRIKESIEFYGTLRALKSIDRCDVAVLVVDGFAGMDKQDLRILEAIVERRRGALIAVNKWDLVEKNDKTAAQYEKAIRAMLRVYDYVPMLFVSALTKQRLVKIMEMAETIHDEVRKRIATNKLNSVLREEIDAKPPSSSTGKEVKIKYITQVGTEPPTFTFFVNEPKLIAEKFKRFLEGRIRRHFGFDGVPLTLHFRRRR